MEKFILGIGKKMKYMAKVYFAYKIQIKEGNKNKLFVIYLAYLHMENY